MTSAGAAVPNGARACKALAGLRGHSGRIHLRIEESDMSQCHIYCRVSSTGQEDNHSLDTQEAACRAYAATHGLSVGSVAREVWSGADRHRPQLDALLDRIISGDVVLAYDLDRLSRGGQIDTAVIIDRIESAGADIAFVTLDFEKSETGALLRNVRAFAAALEREKIVERTGRGKRARVASGKPFASPRSPYGYTWNADKSGYVLDPDAAPIVRKIFDWALAGTPLRGIIRRLEAEGIPSPTGNARWAYPVIRDVLRRPVYTGDAAAYAARSIRRPGGGYIRRIGTSEEVVRLPGIAPAIVTHEEQAAVIARFAVNKAQASRNNRNPEAALLRAGFCFCGHCGRACTVVPASRPGSSPHYRCGSRVEGRSTCPVPFAVASTLDGPVWERVASLLHNPETIAREVARYRTDGGLDRDVEALDKQLTVTSEKQARTARAIAAVDDDDAAAPLLVELKALANRRKALEAERDAVNQRMADRDAEAANVQTLADWCSRVGANLGTLSYAEKRLALQALGAKVSIYRKGARDEAGNVLPRWELALRPLSPTTDIVNGPT